MRRRSWGLILVIAGIATAPGALAPAPVHAASPSDWTTDRASSSQPYEALIAEAANRFGVPETWIRAVIHAESAFDPDAVSSAGALGLMQLMPATYAEMRSLHGLGADPFLPRDNILAGAAYLRHLHDRFGSGGVLGAYNAGPGRYAEHLRTGRALPAETRIYEQRVRRALARKGRIEAASGVGNPSPTPPTTPPDPYASPLFVRRAAPASLAAPAAAAAVPTPMAASIGAAPSTARSLPLGDRE
ncbi:soluble lytic murein transglycosylase-like protein [Brevundimonas sp. UYEF29]|uniref:lytic transglycosylase domain-containing protein n=1 Tax=Brevundimonas sp. UYEF29 TaxID=3156346 RepID=UPI00339602DE